MNRRSGSDRRRPGGPTIADVSVFLEAVLSGTLPTPVVLWDNERKRLALKYGSRVFHINVYLQEAYRCERCNGTNVQHAVWVESNTGDVGEPVGVNDMLHVNYCLDCEESTDFKEPGSDDYDEPGTGQHCPDCEGHGIAEIPESAKPVDAHRCGNCKGWVRADNQPWEPSTEAVLTRIVGTCSQCGVTGLEIGEQFYFTPRDDDGQLLREQGRHVCPGCHRALTKGGPG